MRIAVFASNYSISNDMSGIGLRLWEVSQVLSKEFEVDIYISHLPDLSHPNINFKLFDENTWKEAIDHSDTVLFSDLPDTRVVYYAYTRNKQIIIENSVPIEHIDYDNIRNSIDADELYYQIIDSYKFQILVADHFIARSSVERSTIITSLALCKRINFSTYTDKKLSNLISYIPIGFNSFSDKHAIQTEFSKDNYEFLWTGGVWDLYDISYIPESISHLNKENILVNMTFLYNQKTENIKRFLESSKAKNVENQIHFHDRSVKHFERDSIIKSSKALICLGRDSIENYTCHRLRLRDVFLYSKPIIVDSFGATGDLVEQLGIGMTVSNARELAFAMKEMKENTPLYEYFISNIKKQRQNFLIDCHTEVLRDFIRKNKRANDHERSQKIDRFIKLNPWLLEQQVSPI